MTSGLVFLAFSADPTGPAVDRVVATHIVRFSQLFLVYDMVGSILKLGSTLAWYHCFCKFLSPWREISILTLVRGCYLLNSTCLDFVANWPSYF